MDEYGTSIVQGRLVIQKRQTHGVYHALIVPEGASEEWFFRQFPTQELMFDYARNFNLIVEQEDDES